MAEVVKYILLFFVGIVGLYVVFRLISLGIFKSWFDIKKQQEDKK